MAENKKEQAATETYRVISPSRMVAKRFFRSKLSIVGLCMLLFVFAFSFLGPIIVKFTWGYGQTEVFYIPRTSTMYSVQDFDAPDGKTYDFYDESVSTINFKAPISKDHWLGTDTSGMDIFVRLMYGGRISLMLSFLVIIMETLLGVFFGGLAGYFGKWVDQIIMRVVDVFYCLPGLPILLILSATISSIESIPAEHRIYYVMGFLTLIGWAGTARLVRGQILMLREQEYMMAAEATGLPAWRKIFKHLIPNVMPQLIVSMTLGLGSIILYESTLSYLGLGVPFPNAAWGSMIALADPSKGQEILANYPNMWVPAGVLIIIAVLGFNFVGDGLRDAFDPKARK
ncbi:MAG: ABC transporter permease [Lachnospiraceae bacterium]|nr:ABC transporter permease [Lachnospiraceae bacterium]